MDEAYKLYHIARVAVAFFSICHFTVSASAQGEAVVLPVPRIVIYAGDTIQDSALVDRSFSVTEVARVNPIVRRSDLVGRVARRTLLTGQPVNSAAIKTANAIKQGQPATAVFESAGLTISATVVPLQSVAAGEALSFQNAESGAVLRGVAQADGTIRVGVP